MGAGTRPPLSIHDFLNLIMMIVYVANRRLYLNGKGQVVEENDPTRAELLAPAGGQVPKKLATQLGLLDSEGNPTDLGLGTAAAAKRKAERKRIEEQEAERLAAEEAAKKEAEEREKAAKKANDKAAKPASNK